MTARGRVIGAGLAVSAVAVAALAALSAGESLVVLRAWLVAAHFWTGLSLGAVVLLLIHAITGGRWGEALGPGFRAGAGVMPLCALAWVPLLISADALFPWATTPREDLPEIVVKKLAYLDVGLLQVRTAAVLAIFVGLAWAAGAWSRCMPPVGLAAGGLMVFGIAITVFTVDWLMAFEPTFYSTIYPALHGIGGVVAAMALGTVSVRASLGRHVDRLRDCGMLMLGWAMVWLYLAFMQYLIIWSGDLPHEIEWYILRIEHGWRLVLWIAIAAHAGVVAAMASPVLKARPDAVAAAACVLLLGQAADVWWRTAPVFEREGALAGALDLLAMAALGGLWFVVALAAGAGREREARNG